MEKTMDATLTDFNDTTLPNPLEETKPPQDLLSPGAGSSGLRSPDRRNSPACSRGRTMKDYEDELIALRSENFELKMRIYIMEEQKEMAQGPENADDLKKNTTELKSELATLKKDLAYKEDLILQAAKAMELLDSKHKEAVKDLESKAANEIEHYKSMIVHLEEELKSKEKNAEGPHSAFDDSRAMYAMAFSLPVNNPKMRNAVSEELVSNLELQIINLKKELKESAERYRDLEAAKAALQEEHNYLQEELANHMRRLRESEVAIEFKNGEIKELRDKLSGLRDSNSDTGVVEVKSSQVSRRSPRSQKVRDMEVELRKALNENEQLKVKSEEMKAENDRVMFVLKSLVKDNKEVRKELVTLKSRISQNSDVFQKKGQHDSGTDVEKYKTIVEEMSEKLDLVTKERDSLSLEMERQVQALLMSLKEKEVQLKRYEEKTETVFCDNSEKDNQTAQLEKEISNLRALIDAQTEISSSENDRGKLIEELESKKKQIDHLNEELRKRTFNLQELVNKELWDKNREIEKLNKTCESRQIEVVKLRQQLNIKDLQVCKLEERIRELNKRELPLTDVSSNQNVGCKENSGPIIPIKEQGDERKKLSVEIEKLKEKIKMDAELIERLNGECNKWKRDVELSEKSRKELVNACTLLTTRLEELASFLDSLLPSLGEKKRRMLQQAIERSREASRSFSFSFMDQSNVSVPILPDFSQVDFCSEDESGADTTLKESTQEILQNDEVVRLRTQVESLVEKLKQREGSTQEEPVNSPKRHSIWTLQKDSEQSSDKSSFDLINLASMTEGLALEDVTEGSVLDTLEESDNSKNSGSAKLPDRKTSLVGDGCKVKSPVKRMSVDDMHNGNADCLSESDGMSEPDRSVSMARIGIKVGLLPMPRLSAEDSSSSTRRCVSAPSSVKKMRHETSELRKLNSKLRSLEHVNEALRTELRALCRGSSTARIDKSITCQMDPGNSTNVLTQLSEVSSQLEQSCKLCLQLESKCVTLEGECSALREKLIGEESKNALLKEEIDCLNTKIREAENVSREVMSLRASLKEKENDALEKQCAILELRNSHLIVENRAKIAEAGLEDVKVKWKLLESAALSSEEALKEVRAKWKEAEARLEEIRESASKSEKEKELLKEKYDQETSQLRLRLNQMVTEMDRLSAEHKEALTHASKKIEELYLLKDAAIDEWKLKLEMVEKEKKYEMEEEINRRMDAERKLVMSYEMQTELRSKLEVEMERAREMEVGRKLEERLWKRRVAEVEERKSEREAELRRKLDSVTLATSEAVLERTRLANDKLRLQHQLRNKEDIANQVKNELDHRVAELEAANSELEMRLESLRNGPQIAMSDCEIHMATSPRGFTLNHTLLNRQRSNPSSDYTSDQEPHNNNTNFWFPVCGRSNNNSSPDLGIESDQGRLSSLEPLPDTSCNPASRADEGKLEAENEDLRRQLVRTRRALEETLAQLTTANQKKRQVERAICKQLHKTHHILQKARVNLETDQNSPIE